MATFGGRRGDSALVTALMAGQTIQAAAKSAGVSETTARRRLADPAFRAALDAARAEALERAINALSTLSVIAVATLGELMRGAESEMARLGAARAALENLLKVRELVELEGRLAELERRLGEQGGLRRIR